MQFQKSRNKTEENNCSECTITTCKDFFLLHIFQMIGKIHRFIFSLSDSRHKLFVLIVVWPGTEGSHMTQIKQSTPERALFLIREVSIKPRAQGASCWGDKKRARPLCYRLGHGSCTIHGGDSCSWREMFSYWWTKLASATCNISHEGSLYALLYGVGINF